MKGNILFYDAEKLQGVISGEDGKRYTFTKEDVSGDGALPQGQEVDFLSEDGESAQDVYLLNATTPKVQNIHVSNGPATEYVLCKPGGLFSPRGCYTRAQWWKVFVSLIALSIALWLMEYFFVIKGMADMATNVLNGDAASEISRRVDKKIGLGMVISVIFTISWFVMFWVSLVTSIKRFHDANLSGWMWLLNFIPFVGPIIVFIINGFVGTKPLGNMYCVAKNAHGMPIVKGSPEAEALEKAQAQQLKTKEVKAEENIKQEKAPSKGSKKKTILISVLVFFFVLVIVAYTAIVMPYTVKKTYKDGSKILVTTQGWLPAMTPNIKNARMHGVFKEWYSNGQLHRKEYYRYGAPSGVTKVWSELGQLTQEIHCKNERTWLDFLAPIGEPIYDGPYKTWSYFQEYGKKDGVEGYYPGRTLESKVESSYKNGKQEGVSKKWKYYADGSLSTTEETPYVNGKKEGLSKSYYSNGKLETEKNYKEGIRDGVSKQWKLCCGSSYLSHEIDYKNGKIEGIYKKYHKDGSIDYIQNYKNGKKDGILKGWSTKGILTHEGNYANGKRHGVQKTYDYSTGILKKEAYYNFGVKEGSYKTWYNNGKPKEVGQYYSGRRTGTWKYYDSRGRVRTTNYR